MNREQDRRYSVERLCTGSRYLVHGLLLLSLANAAAAFLVPSAVAVVVGPKVEGGLAAAAV